MKKIMILATLLSLTLSACVTTQQVKDGTEISVNAYVVNEAVDGVQVVIGQYSVNQETIKDLDKLQADISEALQGGSALLQIDSFYGRGVTIYNVLNAEAIERDAELTPIQRDILHVLNKTILSLDTKIKAFKENKDNVELIGSVGELVDLVGTAKTVLSLYAL